MIGKTNFVTSCYCAWESDILVCKAYLFKALDVVYLHDATKDWMIVGLQSSC